MPPSPVMRVSPGRELKVENHKRGRSLESGILYREKEDDLALFNEVQNRGDGFLLQSNENFDDFFSTKLRCFSGNKLGVSIPAQGESSDLLNAERDKNDYDWLITPPETPLFRSLDDEEQPVKLAPRGRPRSQPVSLSRSPTMDKDYSGRGSASPHRLSPSPRSGNSTLQSRSRPFSANHSSPPPTIRHTSPVRRLSPPPSKPASAPRSSTPTPRRLSTGSTGTSPSRVRGSSPIKTSRGNSASPKLRAWQTNVPGFSSEAPANLRTTLADRPASYVRGSSPASRDSSRYGRQSMAPTALRSVASSHSHDQDPFSPYSKGSVASSGDDVDSPQSISLSSSEQSAPRNIGAQPSNNAMSLSRKPLKKLSSSAPKRSFDLVRQMVQDRNGPHNMFRPLLSNVPSSTFHAGKVSAHQCSLTSRNSSMITSSSASCDQAASGAHDTEASELNQEDVTSDTVRGHHPDMDDEVFFMEHGDDINEVSESRIMDDSLGSQHCENDGSLIVVSTLDVGSSNRFDTTIVMNSPILLDDGAPDRVTCSKCGHIFHSAEEVMEGDLQLCLDCRCLEEALDQSASTSECLHLTCTGPSGKNHLVSQNSYSDSSQSLSVELFEEGEPTLTSEKVIEQPVDSDKGYEQLNLDGVNSSSRLHVSEGAGISLLLKRSSSVERHIVQSRSFTASTTSYEDFSYARDSSNSMRSSIERTSASVSSSIDLGGSSRQTELRNLWQSSSHKSDTENYRYETPAKLKRSVSSVSSASGHMCQVRSATPSCHEDGFEEITGCINKELGEEMHVDPRERLLASEFTEAESTCSDIESNIVCKTASELSSRLMNDHSGETPVHSVLTSQEPASHENRDYLMNNSHNLSMAETSSVHLVTSNQDDATPTSCADMVDAVCNPNFLNSISEIEIENDDDAYYGSHSDVDSTSELQLDDASAVRSTAKEYEISHHIHVREESRIFLEDTGQAKAKTLTLEEAADAILFCSSIIHNLAYEAANLAIDNEALPVEVLRPEVTLVGKSNFERRDTRLRKRNSRSQKARKKNVEMETAPSACNAETNEKSSPCINGPSDDGAPDNGDSMKPPKLDSKCNCLIM